MTEDLIYSTAINDGMPSLLAKFIVAQSKHETGNYTSKFFRLNNNAFGYSYVKGGKWQLPNSGSIADNGKPVANYATVNNSVHELTDWIKRRQKEKKFPANLNDITTSNKYSKLLKNSGYYGDTYANYSRGLASFLKMLPKDLGSSSLILIAVIILIIILFTI